MARPRTASKPKVDLLNDKDVRQQFFNGKAVALILGVTPGAICRWSKEGKHPLLVPVWGSTYHRRQLELYIDVLAGNIEEAFAMAKWRAVRASLGQVVLDNVSELFKRQKARKRAS